MRSSHVVPVSIACWIRFQLFTSSCLGARNLYPMLIRIFPHSGQGYCGRTGVCFVLYQCGFLNTLRHSKQACAESSGIINFSGLRWPSAADTTTFPQWPVMLEDLDLPRICAHVFLMNCIFQNIPSILVPNIPRVNLTSRLLLPDSPESKYMRHLKFQIPNLALY